MTLGRSTSTRRLRLALVISSLGMGGAERVMSILASAWAECGHSVTIFTFIREEAYELHPQIELKCLCLPKKHSGPVAGIGRNLRRLIWLRRELQELRPEMVVSFLDCTNVLAILACRSLSLPIIVSERIHPHHHHIGLVWRCLRRMTYPMASCLVVQTPSIAQCFTGWKRLRVEILPNPVLRARPIVDAGKIGPGSHVVAIGRLVVQKGFDLLLRAFQIVRARCPLAHLTIWGEGPEREHLIGLASKLGLSAAVNLPGNTKDVHHALAMADVFAFSSRFEGFPNALCEAMSCGVPPISFDCPGGPRDIIHDGIDGILVPPGDIDAMAAGIAGLLEDGAKRQTLGRAALDVCKIFSIERILARWEEVMTGALSRSPGHEATEASNSR